MKFKAVIENEGAAGANQTMILHVLQAMHRLERASERKPTGRTASIVLKLTADSFAFCHRAGADEGSQTWSHFQPARLFSEYRVESKRQNKIDLEVPIANLVHVFQNCGASDRTTLRLANGRDGRPIISFEFALVGNAADHKVGQEVPVRVIPEVEAEAIREPELPEPEYQIELPGGLQRLRNVLDKMRAVGAQHVEVEACQETLQQQPTQPQQQQAQTPHQAAGSGRASLRVAAESELVTIATTFPSLALVKEGKQAPCPDRPVRLHLSLRRLGEVLAGLSQVNAMMHIAVLLENRALVLYALLPNSQGSVISYTPAVTA